MGFGEAAGNFKSGSKYDLGVGYNVGGFSAALTWDRQNGASTSTMLAGTTDYIQGICVGTSYDFDALKLFAGYRNYKRAFMTAVAGQRSDMYWAGASYDMTPTFTLCGAVYKQDIKGGTNADPILFSVCGQYTLSKCTTAYLPADYTKAKNGQNVSLSRDVVGYNNNQIDVTAGLQHRFRLTDRSQKHGHLEVPVLSDRRAARQAVSQASCGIPACAARRGNRRRRQGPA